MSNSSSMFFSYYMKVCVPVSAVASFAHLPEPGLQLGDAALVDLFLLLEVLLELGLVLLHLTNNALAIT